MSHHDDLDDLDPLDELASAHIDGMTTPEEAARIDADPELQRRVTEMEAVQDAVWAAVPPVDDTARDRAIAAALLAFDDDAFEEAPAEARVLAPRRGARELAAWPNRRVRILGIAAALVLVVLAVPLVAQLGGSDDDDSGDEMATGADESAEEEAADRDLESDAALDDAAPDAGSESAEGDGSGAEAYSSDATAAPTTVQVREVEGMVDLGAFDDGASLHDAVRAVLVDEGPAPVTSQPDSGPASEAAAACATEAGGVDEPGSRIALQGTAVLDGQPVALTVVELPDGGLTLTVADPASSCATVFTSELTP